MTKYGFVKLMNRIKNNLAKLTGMCGVTPKQHALSEIENQCYKSSLVCKSRGKWVSLRGTYTFIKRGKRMRLQVRGGRGALEFQEK